MSETDWPFDADQHDPLAALRIPVVTSLYPGWKYEMCVVITSPDSPDDIWGPALRPGEAETRMLAAYLEYKMEWYNAGWQAKMRKRPLDVDSGTNTVVFQKRAEGDWHYRRASWQYGPLTVGAPDGQPLGLEALLDRIHLYGDDEPAPKWVEWKAAHPEAFPVEASHA
jgi:hypothetical protein